MKKIVDFIKCFKNLFIYLLLLGILNIYINNSVINLLIICLNLLFFNSNLFKNKEIDFKKNLKKYLLLIIKYWLVGALLMFISNIIINHFTHTIAINEAINRNQLSNNFISSIITMIILTPFCEEIVFRGSFKSIIKNKYFFCIFTAILFGLLHVVFNSDIIYMIPYALLGYYLAKVYFETDNIYTSIIMHMWHNLVCIVILVMGVII